MTKLVQRARQRVKRIIKNLAVEASARRFIAFCQRKWPWDPAAKYDSVVLMDCFAHKIATYCNGHAANYLARRTGSGIEFFAILRGRNYFIRRVYDSFGARWGLTASFAESARERLEKQADIIFEGLKSKSDLLDLRIEGLKVGDLVYDTYLRWYEEPTVTLADPRLRKLIFETLFVYEAITNYLKAKKVEAFIATDYCYHEPGVITRVLIRENVPVYLVCYGPQHFLYRLWVEPESGLYDFPIRWPYQHYRKLFRALPPAEQKRALAVGHDYVDGKLAGKIDKLSRMEVTAFGEAQARIFPDTGKPRILILLHDFIDAPHGYRWMLFPDFYEWICFLLERASETDFEWYLKPHPCSWDPARQGITDVNVRATDEVLARFPKIKLLEPTVSNRQIVQEGIAAMFTVYGTAGHEFARMGVASVNAGDNPHIDYDFNYNPRTVEEYADLIARADRLTVQAHPDEIAEYAYMNYFYFADQLSTPANPLPAEFFADPNYDALCAAPNGYDRLIASQEAQREVKMEKYYDTFFRDHPRRAASA